MAAYAVVADELAPTAAKEVLQSATAALEVVADEVAPIAAKEVLHIAAAPDEVVADEVAPDVDEEVEADEVRARGRKGRASRRQKNYDKPQVRLGAKRIKKLEQSRAEVTKLMQSPSEISRSAWIDLLHQIETELAAARDFWS